MANKKSDVKAKEVFVNELTNRGFQNARVTASPCDVQAEKDGVTWYFEIKMTKRQDNYFGAATTTEWAQALRTPDRFRFVVAQTDADENHFEFTEYTPAEFMEYSTIPPFKIFFNIPLASVSKKGRNKVSKALRATSDNLRKLIGIYDEMKNTQSSNP